MIGAGIFVLTGIAAGTTGLSLMLAFALNGVVTVFTAMMSPSSAQRSPRRAAATCVSRTRWDGPKASWPGGCRGSRMPWPVRCMRWGSAASRTCCSNERGGAFRTCRSSAPRRRSAWRSRWCSLRSTSVARRRPGWPATSSRLRDHRPGRRGGPGPTTVDPPCGVQVVADRDPDLRAGRNHRDRRGRAAGRAGDVAVPRRATGARAGVGRRPVHALRHDRDPVRWPAVDHLRAERHDLLIDPGVVRDGPRQGPARRLREGPQALQDPVHRLGRPPAGSSCSWLSRSRSRTWPPPRM